MASIVVPAYNEEGRIGKLLQSLLNHFSQDVEIFVICNGCTDSTVEIVKTFQSHNPQVKCFEFKDKLGKGGAVIKGFQQVKSDLACFIDADDSFPPEDIKKVLSNLKGYDCAIASRYVPGASSKVDEPFLRRIAGRIFNFYVQLLFNLNINDTQCGLKAFKKELLEKVLPKLETKGFEFDVEVLWRCKMLGANIIEVPVTWEFKTESTFSLVRDSPGMFLSLFLLFLKNKGVE